MKVTALLILIIKSAPWDISHTHFWIVNFSHPHTGPEPLHVDLKTQWGIIWLEFDSMVQQPAGSCSVRREKKCLLDASAGQSQWGAKGGAFLP